MKGDLIKEALSKLPLTNSKGEHLVACPSCNGKGRGPSGTCGVCSGAGLVTAKKRQQVLDEAVRLKAQGRSGR